MLTEVYESIAGLLLPQLCPRCEEPAAAGFCRACRAEFPGNEAHCPVCAEPGAAENCRHGHGGPDGWHIESTIAPFIYAPPIDIYIHALKFAGRRLLGRAFGQLLAEQVMARRGQVDALVAVPLHQARLRERGYNQAVEIASSVSQELHLPVLLAGISKNRDTAAQAELSASERRRNLRGAFDIRRDLRDLRLAIVDDVVTTGATVNALARALRAAGAVRVEAWALARTPRQAVKT